MDYYVERGAERLGPYSLTELQQGVAEGRISTSDLVRNDALSTAVPVEQIIGNIPTRPAQIAGPPPAPARDEAHIPLPANLGWIWLLIIDVCTRSIFNVIWCLVQANWARKLDPNSKALVLAAMYPASFLAAVLSFMNPSLHGLGMLFVALGALAFIVSAFSIRQAMDVTITRSRFSAFT